MISKQDYGISVKSLKACLHHLQTIDLAELAAGVAVHGTPADAALIEKARAFLAVLPLIHP